MHSDVFYIYTFPHFVAKSMRNPSKTYDGLCIKNLMFIPLIIVVGHRKQRYYDVINFMISLTDVVSNCACKFTSSTDFTVIGKYTCHHRYHRHSRDFDFSIFAFVISGSAISIAYFSRTAGTLTQNEKRRKKKQEKKNSAL